MHVIDLILHNFIPLLIFALKSFMKIKPLIYFKLIQNAHDIYKHPLLQKDAIY